MKVIEVPLLNEDGSVQATVTLSAKEAQFLLEFALNFLSGVGVHNIVKTGAIEVAEVKHELND